MWNLFKEVFKSLYKNKITLTGLTILIFLSSGIFTLFHDMSKSMKKQYKSYKQLSNGHDLTVDLNIPVSGTLYNNGYFINGLSQLEGGAYYDQPLNYNTNDYLIIKNIIDISAIENEYINLSNFIDKDSNFSNKYIKRSDFLRFYNFFTNKNNFFDVFDLNFSNSKKHLKISSDYFFDTFEKKNKKFIRNKKEIILNKNAIYNFSENYKLSDIVNINKNDSDIVFSQLSSLFINFKTNELTFDFQKGKEWENKNQGYKLNSEDLAEILGLKPYKNSSSVYTIDASKNSAFLEFPEDTKNLEQFYKINLKNNFSYFDIFNDKSIKILVNSDFGFLNNKIYNIPLKWAAVEREVTHFRRKLYTTSYTKENQDKWTGSYKTFIQSVFSSNDDKLRKKYLKFAYWDREINRYVKKFDENGNLKNDEILISSLNPSLTFDEINNIKLKLSSPEQQPKNVNLKKFDFQNEKTIAQIEGFEQIDKENFEIITNKSHKDKIIKSIVDSALKISKQSIVDSVKNIVGEENLGYRQTVTVESVDTDGKKNVYNFVNIGDSDSKVNNVKLNVDKLIKEDNDKTLISEVTKPIDEFFLKKQLNTFVAKEIISNARSNISPVSEFIIVDYDYQDVIFIDKQNNSETEFKNKKIYKLADYIVEENNKDLINTFNGYGITILNNEKIVLLKAILNEDNKINYWTNVDDKTYTNGIFTIDEFYEYMLKFNWTLRTKYINPKGWGQIDPNFPNIVSVPFAYRSPKLDILQEALNQNSLNLGLDYIEKTLYNSDLVKEEFLSKESIYNLIDAFSKVIIRNDFARVFSSGNINFIIIPKMLLDLIYELSHNQKGDYFTKIIISILDRIEFLINQKITLNDKKIYLKDQIENLFTFINKVFGVNLFSTILPETLVNISNDPIIFINALKELVLSFDFRGFSERVRLFFDTVYNQKVLIDGIERERKLSSIELSIWLLENADQKLIKKALFKMIDNLDIKFIFDSPNGISKLIKNFIPGFDLLNSGILEKINDSNNSQENKYANVKSGLKTIIENFDLKILLEELTKKVSVVSFDKEVFINNTVTGIFENVTKHYVSGSVNNTDIFTAIIKSLFGVPGLDKIYKDQIVKIFNLSNKGTSLKIENNKFLNIPASDPNKLDFFDVLKLGLKNNNISDKKSESTLVKIHTIIKKIKKNKITDFKTIPIEFQEVLNVYLDFKNDQPIDLEKVNDWDIILSKLSFNTSELSYKNDLSIGSLAYYFENFNNNYNGNFIFNIVSNLLKDLVKVENNNQYDYVSNSWVLFKNWWKIFVDNPEISDDRKIDFLNDWLKLANQKEIIDSFNSFELFQPSAQNIAAFKDTNFGISRSLSNPNKMQELFFKKNNNNKYVNTFLKELFNKYPEFEPIIKQQEFIWTVIFSELAASDQYLKIKDKKLNGIEIPYQGIHSIIINNFLNGFLKNKLIHQYKNQLNIIFSDYKSIPISILGLSDILINPILIPFYPQVLIWYLTNTDDIKSDVTNNANLAYFVQNKLINFEEIIKNQNSEELDKFINNLVQKEIKKPIFESDYVFQIAIDDDYFLWQFQTDEYKNNKYSFFGINLYDLIWSSINSITSYKVEKDLLNFSQISSNVTKVNYSYLAANNKKIYNGQLPTNPISLQILLNEIGDEYVVKVNGSKFLIVGEDSTYDYLYPVIDESNLQVDTTNQAILYVNDKGFSRIQYAYKGNLVKEYLVIKAPEGTSLVNLQNQIETIVQNIINDPNKIKRTYLYNEIDGFNPERSIRISALERIIKSVSTISIQLSIFLFILVGISIIFIIKRYVSNRNKFIGILIAQGYTPLQIALSMTSFSFFASLIGGIIGYLTGFFNQAFGLKIISAYWTIPIQTLEFSVISFILTVILPMIGMCVLTILVTLHSLRHKSIDLMSGIADLSIGNLQMKYQKIFKSINVKGRFSASLIFNSFWKLLAFGISVILTSIATIFQFSTSGIFEKSISQTYQNRQYSYKIDLITPTIEGGAILPFDNNLKNNLYTPIGNISEINQVQNDYFRPGISTAINTDGKNGNPNEFNSHIITQFSVNLKIDGIISLDPWSIVYNSLPDFQKAKIINQRNQVALMLEKTQEHVVFDKNGLLDIKETGKSRKDFFHYLPNSENVAEGKFFYLKWNNFDEQYDHKVITTSQYRDEYRKFLIEAYKKIPLNSKINDYYVSFGGIYFNEENDETYTYVDSIYKENSIRLYGYQKDSKLIKIIDENEVNLLDQINNEFNFESNLNDPIPLIINNVIRDKYNLKIGSVIEIPILNTTTRFTDKLKSIINNKEFVPTNKKYKFKVKGINPTFINNELIIPKQAADMLVGLDKLNNNPKYGAFNGILSKDKIPQQLLNSTSIYSLSGYYGILQTFDINSLNLVEKQNIYDAIFSTKSSSPNNLIEGTLKLWGWTDEQIGKFIDSSFDSKNTNFKEIFDKYRDDPTNIIEKFTKVFDNITYIPTASSLNSKDIEVGFTTTIARTVQIIVSFITLLTFIVSMVILMIVSTILINENEKNIAIWTILGYNQKEKVKMFFGIYIPFIVLSILVSIPLAYGIMKFFSMFLTTAASIAIPLGLSFFSIGITFIIILGVFALISTILWQAINKIKAIDLLKGK
ncbi:ABC transporter permease [Mycoplasmopsis cricetuli]|uniref:ABC transporter permease n=1 Tax=Mycoplasmopsis cricetuli TaxID=171283 RepID=UPI000470D0E6|nr:ABC transporter permease [Mycoplasmopsis cricetuli]